MLLKTKEIMDKLNVSRHTIYNYIDKGMPVKKIGITLRFDYEEVIEWINNQNTKE
jgi:excisionase family DNA binding protein